MHPEIRPAPFADGQKPGVLQWGIQGFGGQGLRKIRAPSSPPPPQLLFLPREALLVAVLPQVRRRLLSPGHDPIVQNHRRVPGPSDLLHGPPPEDAGDLIPLPGPRGPDRLHTLLVLLVRLLGQAGRYAQLVQDAIHDLLEVERVKVQTGRTGLHERPASLGAEFHAERLDRFGVVLDAVHLSFQFRGNASLAEFRHLLETVVGVDAHETGHDRAVDAPIPAILDECGVNLRVEEHLGDDEVGPGVHLLLEVIHLLLVILIPANEGLAVQDRTPRLLRFRHGTLLPLLQLRDRVRMSLRIPRDADAEVVAELLTYVPDQVEGAGEPPLRGLPGRFAGGGIAAKGDDVAYAAVEGRLEGVADGGLGIAVFFHVGAG
mmetsp:Transcript_6656/g.13961  ORF Transcript_6656/g.13961 Transcript_6656/m.13961 type:complete len:375 (+) Transcript_6656:61-1185(+)